jgi:superfamily II DNA or RNA helicase
VILPLWPFQQECVDSIWSAIDEGYQRFAVVLPTGSGKTTVFTHLSVQALAKRFRVLILVDRDELVKQTVTSFHSVAPDVRVGVFKGSRKELDAPVTIASVQTLSRENNLHTIDPDRWNLIIVDECHGSAADGYQRILRYFGAWLDRSASVPVSMGTRHSTINHDQNNTVNPGAWKTALQNTIVVGFTATLVRSDARKLGDTFQTITGRPRGVAYFKPLEWMIRHGYLVDVRGREITLDLDLGDVGRSAGDYQVGALGDGLIQAHAGQHIADFIRDEVADRQVMVFMPNIKSAEDCLNTLRLKGFSAEAVYGSTSIEDRTLIYKRLRTGETQVFVNVGVGVQGFDMPHISCVILGHITQSIGRFIQMVGRGLRKSNRHDPASPYPWMRTPKTDCVVGLLGAQNGVRLATMVDLSETTVKEIKPGETLTEAIAREAEETQAETEAFEGRILITDVDLFAQESRFRFRMTEKGYRYIPAGDWLIAVLPQTTAPDTLYAVGTRYVGKKNPALNKGKTIVTNVTEGYALAWAEEVAENLDPVGTVAQKGAAWRKRKNEPATALQMIKATQLRIPQPWPSTKVELSDVIDTVVGNRALDFWTPKQPPTEED